MLQYFIFVLTVFCHHKLILIQKKIRLKQKYRKQHVEKNVARKKGKTIQRENNVFCVYFLHSLGLPDLAEFCRIFAMY